MLRRAFTQAFLALPCAALTVACHTKHSREQVLGGLIREIVAPSTRALASESSALRSASDAFIRSPSVQALRTLRSAWRRAALSWKAASIFQDGPLVESKALLRASYWPVLPDAIDTLLKGATDLDQRAFSDLSLNQRGLYALEYLLFPAERDEQLSLSLFAADEGKRRRLLLGALTHDLAQQAERALQALGDGNEYARRFARGGQQSLSLVLAQLILGVETFAVNRVDLVLTLAERRLLKPSDVEGWPSGSSHQLLQAALTAIERLYRGGPSGGLAELVQTAAPTIAERARLAFESALTATGGLAAPLERLASERPEALRTVLATSKRLEVALKVDVASALGVTLTFQSNDGD